MEDDIDSYGYGDCVNENDVDEEDDDFDWHNLSEDRLLFVPLGGTGEIGMNFNLFHYLGKWLILDCGAGFAGEDLPGVDIIVPDPSFIEKRAKDIVGMVITHAHEDHLGAVPYLWKSLRCPIYTTKFTANFLRSKLVDKGLLSKVPLTVIEGNTLDLDPFKLRFYSLTHSVPEMRAVAITTAEGTIFHTGDWKFDEEPIIGEVSDIEGLQELGDSDVLAMICDSTNIFSHGESKSEGSLVEPIKAIIEQCDGLVAVSMFASNIARISTFCDIAKKTGRRVAILGKSLHNVTSVAQESGYLEDVEFLDGRKLPEDCEREKLLVICTGCQGDRLAAINRLSENTFRDFSLYEGETVVFSSKMIPGNEKRISAVINRFVRMGVNVITERTHTVHVSGHPYRDEVKRMYSLIKPKIAVPVHGEHVHLIEHANIARECGVPEPVLVEDGGIVCLNRDFDGEDRVIGRVGVGYFGVDGKLLKSPDSVVMHLRRRIRDGGIVIVVMAFDRRFKLLKMPTISAPGCIDSKVFLKKVASAIENMILAGKRWSYSDIISSVKSKVKEMVLDYSGKRPVIEVKVEQL